jgi:hypothetical protein
VFAPTSAAADATFKIEQKPNGETILSAECGPTLTLTIGIKAVLEKNDASEAAPLKITTKYTGVELDPGEWDLPMVKAMKKRGPVMLKKAQATKHLADLKAENLTAAAIEDSLNEIKADLKNAKSKKEKDKDDKEKDKDQKEIDRLTDKKDLTKKKLSARRLVDAMELLVNTGVRYRVYYQAAETDGTPHEVDLIVPEAVADAKKELTAAHGK